MRHPTTARFAEAVRLPAAATGSPCADLGASVDATIFGVGLLEEDSYKGAMMRLALPVLALFVVACGGGQSEAEQPKAERLTEGEKCIRTANIKQTPPVDAPQRIDVSHIVVKHDQVKGAIKENISRTREAACLRASKARDFLLSSNDWEAGYKKYSDEHGAMEGALNDIGQGDTDTAFSNAAFSLKVDELSNVVETPRGFHIILRRK